MSGQKQEGVTNIALMISDLGFGGAERQVVELANNIDADEFNVSVIVMNKVNPLAASLDKELCVLGKRNKYDIGVVSKLAQLLGSRDIQLIHSFLFDADIAARMCKGKNGWPKVISSERNSYYRQKLTHVVADRLTKNRMDRLIANSIAGRQFCIDHRGIDPLKIEVVHNGVDTSRFQPGVDGVAGFRRQYDIPDSASLIGMVGNYKSQKNHQIFVRMAALIAEILDDCYFAIVGNEIAGSAESSRIRDSVVAEVNRAGLASKFRFTDSLDRMEIFYNACNLTVLPSSREGTPNVVLESMACGTPVLATDVADNRHILGNGDCGCLVELRDLVETAEDFAASAVRILSARELLSELSRKARARTVSEFSVSNLVKKTTAIYRATLEAQ